ncbi:MAG: ComEC/Rec2 family competence protein, partial [Polyangiaceae bacterium]|nr:ComEC/Rec2 family competence protein [Polyangiaceae bacterium]
MTTGRLDPILLCAMAAACGCGLVLAPWPSAAAAGGAVVVLVADRARAARDARGSARLGALVVLAAALFGLSAWRSAALLRAASARYAATLGALPAPALCAFRARVASSPVVLERGAGPGPSGAHEGARARAPSTGRSRVDVDVLGGECTLAQRPDPGAADAHAEAEAEPADRVIALAAPLRVRLYAAPDDAERGDELELLAQLAPVHLFWNPGLADPRTSIHATGVTASGTVLDAHATARGGGVAALVDRARHAVRGRIQATFAPGVEPLARALVLGETDLDPADSEAFRQSGLSHLLAVSGTHLVLVVLAVERALRALAARIAALAARFDVGRATAALGAPLAWLYADFAGGSGSARRAAAMMTVAM